MTDLSQVRWRKAKASANNGSCVEVGTWCRSSHSAEEGHCVEVGMREAGVLARDSKDPDGPVLSFGADAWGAFLDAVKSGRLDLS